MTASPIAIKMQVKGRENSVPSVAFRTSACVSKSAGFTLFELLIVLAITVLGLSVVAVNFSSGKSSMELKAAVRDVASALRYARGQALMTHRDTQVEFNLADNSYTISGRDKIFTLPESLELTLVTAQSELSGNEQGSIRFFADGSSTGGRVTLEHGETAWRIDINWLTGQADIEDATSL